MKQFDGPSHQTIQATPEAPLQPTSSVPPKKRVQVHVHTTAQGANMTLPGTQHVTWLEPATLATECRVMPSGATEVNASSTHAPLAETLLLILGEWLIS